MPGRKLTHDGALASTIGINARAARVTADRRLLDVATDAGISESMLSKVENGRVLPGVLVLASLARALGVQPGTLFETAKVAA